MPLDQLARAIANTIDSNTARSPGAPLAFDGTSIQGLQIIIHFIANDAALYARAKPNMGRMR